MKDDPCILIWRGDPQEMRDNRCGVRYCWNRTSTTCLTLDSYRFLATRSHPAFATVHHGTPSTVTCRGPSRCEGFEVVCAASLANGICCGSALSLLCNCNCTHPNMQTSNILLAVFCTVGGVVILALLAVLVMKNKQPAATTASSSRTRSSRSRPVGAERQTGLTPARRRVALLVYPGVRAAPPQPCTLRRVPRPRHQ